MPPSTCYVLSLRIGARDESFKVREEIRKALVGRRDGGIQVIHLHILQAKRHRGTLKSQAVLSQATRTFPHAARCAGADNIRRMFVPTFGKRQQLLAAEFLCGK